LNESGQTKLEDQVVFLKKYLEKLTNCPESKISELHKKISYFDSDFKKKWLSSYRMKKRFETNNSVWLEKSLGFSNYKLYSGNSGVGRPKISFDLASEEALSMFVEAELSKDQYNMIRNKDKERFPSYKKIQQAKRKCYPKNQYISITDSTVDIKQQGLLDHTILHLMQTQYKVIERQENVQKLCLITKWGFDGSSGHSEYKQKFIISATNNASIFLSSLVPLRLISGDPDLPTQQQIVLWNDLRSSSTRYCRHIRFQFAHETTDLAKREKDYIESQIRELVPTLYKINGRIIEINHKLLLTMVDGKICNSLTDTTSTMRCFYII